MTRLNDLPKELRLDLIEETRLQRGAKWTDECIEDNCTIACMCDLSITRQGYGYWKSVDLKMIIG